MTLPRRPAKTLDDALSSAPLMEADLARRLNEAFAQWGDAFPGQADRMTAMRVMLGTSLGLALTMCEMNVERAVDLITRCIRKGIDEGEVDKALHVLQGDSS